MRHWTEKNCSIPSSRRHFYSSEAHQFKRGIELKEILNSQFYGPFLLFRHQPVEMRHWTEKNCSIPSSRRHFYSPEAHQFKRGIELKEILNFQFYGPFLLFRHQPVEMRHWTEKSCSIPSSRRHFYSPEAHQFKRGIELKEILNSQFYGPFLLFRHQPVEMRH